MIVGECGVVSEWTGAYTLTARVGANLMRR